MFYVGSDAMRSRSSDLANMAHDFLGVPAGSTMFVLPEVENTNLLFLALAVKSSPVVSWRRCRNAAVGVCVRAGTFLYLASRPDSDDASINHGDIRWH